MGSRRREPFVDQSQGHIRACFGDPWQERANPRGRILIGLSGRGDKDMPTLQRTVLKEEA